MISQEFIQSIVNGLVHYATDLLLPLMVLMFIGGVIFRTLIHYTIWREMAFAKEFDKRVTTFLDRTEIDAHLSFYAITKRLLEKTFYELFVVRAIMKRRNPDVVMTLSDRVFLTRQGAAWIVNDVLKQVKHLKHERRPKLLQITKNTLQNNPCFNKVFGLLPGSVLNDLITILPGILVICGIFGTFLGIMAALPELGAMDLTDVEETKMVMDNFLLKTSFAMSTSLVGILLSILLSVYNSLFSPDKLFADIVDRFENALDRLWNRSNSNELPKDDHFDEHRDPIAALAEEALHQELDGTHTIGKKMKVKSSHPNKKLKKDAS